MNHRSVARVLLGWAAIGLVLGSACSCGGLKVKSNGGVDAAPDARGVYDSAYESLCSPYSPPSGTCCDSPPALKSVSPDTPCIFTVPFSLPDPNNIGVYLDKNLVPKDATNGWQFGDTTSTVVLFGTYCDTIVAEGPSSYIQVICACPPWGAPPPCITP